MHPAGYLFETSDILFNSMMHASSILKFLHCDSGLQMRTCLIVFIGFSPYSLIYFALHLKACHYFYPCILFLYLSCRRRWT